MGPRAFLPFSSPPSLSCQSSVAWRGDGAGPRSEGGASESIFWPPGPGLARRPHLQRGGARARHSQRKRQPRVWRGARLAAPAPELRGPPVSAEQGRGPGGTDWGLRSKKPWHRRQSPSSGSASGREQIGKVRDRCGSDSASQHLGLAPSRTGENLRKPGRDLGDTAAFILNSLEIQSPWYLAASQTLWRSRS